MDLPEANEKKRECRNVAKVGVVRETDGKQSQCSPDACKQQARKEQAALTLDLPGKAPMRVDREQQHACSRKIGERR